ncbi:translation machinery-associated protein 16 [Coemansia erecta]|uniref:Translation machinery-associated protein 16 n=1 Tax=Coemansia erecta TaxID=147472 RepID=A0A9W7Y1B1_9FUNG|nr:translation machinery-associated protein 16 [Coemansia erecta]
MPNNKRKRVAKIKGKEKAHPYSRKARQIARAMNTESMIARNKSDRLNMAMSRGQKLVWFRDNLDEIEYAEAPENTGEDGQKIKWTMYELGQLVDLYLERHEEELEKIDEKKKLGRLLTPKEALFLENIKVERNEAEMSGLEVPDLTDKELVEFLRGWDGDVNSVSLIKKIRCKPASAQETEDTAPVVGSSQNQAIAEITGLSVE